MNLFIQPLDLQTDILQCGVVNFSGAIKLVGDIPYPVKRPLNLVLQRLNLGLNSIYPPQLIRLKRGLPDPRSNAPKKRTHICTSYSPVTTKREPSNPSPVSSGAIVMLTASIACI